MLIRFVTKNTFSFFEETEFNVFPGRSQQLQHHKVNRNGIELLRLSAIYGANGAGKSNLINSISLLQDMIVAGEIMDDLDEIKFQLNDKCEDIPVSFGIEFYHKATIYYYTLTFDNNIILNESLYESNKREDKLIFSREYENNKQVINFKVDYSLDSKNTLFIDVLSEKLLLNNVLLLTFLNNKYPDELPEIINAFEWLTKVLIILDPETKPGGIAAILDKYEKLKTFSNNLISTFNTGIEEIEVSKQKFSEFVKGSDEKEIKRLIENVNKSPDDITILLHKTTKEEVSLISENGEIYAKKLVTSHLNNKGEKRFFYLKMESDGTKRLIDYLPALEGIINHESVYLIDEIERSIHPLTIKEIIRKISHDEAAKGQLIFTTHESSLLDQSILRPDEIWFAQKDIDGSTKLYSLSDYNIHKTASIENGYLNGRYGGIPFLSNLEDLNWHSDEVFS